MKSRFLIAAVCLAACGLTATDAKACFFSRPKFCGQRPVTLRPGCGGQTRCQAPAPAQAVPATLIQAAPATTIEMPGTPPAAVERIAASSCPNGNCPNQRAVPVSKFRLFNR